MGKYLIKVFITVTIAVRVKIFFDITLHEDIVFIKSTIHYLDCIDAPATDMSSIYQVNVAFLLWTNTMFSTCNFMVMVMVEFNVIQELSLPSF